MNPMVIIRKLLSDHSEIKKRTSEFLGEVQAMIDNNSSKLIWSITEDIAVSDFFFYLTGSA